MSFLPDTSCLVAAVLSWHEHHEVTASEVEARLDEGEEMVLAAHGLVEAYAVLTRLPPPQRLDSTDARELLMGGFVASGRVVALDARGHLSMLRDAPEAGVSGGRSYDYLIFRTAQRARVSTLLTLNERHFAPFATAALEVTAPGSTL